MSGFARFFSYPAPLQKAIRLSKKLQREISRQRSGRSEPARPRSHRTGVKLVRWTPALDEILRQNYPTMPRDELAASMGVSVLSLSCRAKRLGLKRSPESMARVARERGANAKAQAFNERSSNADHQ